LIFDGEVVVGIDYTEPAGASANGMNQPPGA
jgi:hypothetical protein